jgi:hypothetical protein
MFIYVIKTITYLFILLSFIWDIHSQDNINNESMIILKEFLNIKAEMRFIL